MSCVYCYDTVAYVYCYVTVVCIPHSFLVINVCNQGKTLCSPCIMIKTYGHGSWSFTKREKHRMRVFKNTLLRKIFGRKTDEVTGEWRELHNEELNPSNPELNPICYLLALLGAHHFLHVSRIRVKLLTFRQLMSYIYIYGAPILDVSRSHTTTQHSR